MEEKNYRIIENENAEAQHTTLRVSPLQKTAIGQAAKSQAVQNPERTPWRSTPIMALNPRRWVVLAITGSTFRLAALLSWENI